MGKRVTEGDHATNEEVDDSVRAEDKSKGPRLSEKEKTRREGASGEAQSICSGALGS